MPEIGCFAIVCQKISATILTENPQVINSQRRKKSYFICARLRHEYFT